VLVATCYFILIIILIVCDVNKQTFPSVFYFETVFKTTRFFYQDSKLHFDHSFYCSILILMYKMNVD
jgi:hypothetical protein